MTRSKGFINVLAAGAIAISMTGCATALTPAGSKITLATPSQKEKCRSLGVVVATQKIGQDKAASAMNAALNMVAERGGDSLYVVSSSTDWADGSSVVGEALKCGA